MGMTVQQHMTATPEGRSNVDVELNDDILVSLFRASPDPLLVVGEAGDIVFANERALVLFGWDVVELVGQQICRLVPAGFVDGDEPAQADHRWNRSTRALGESRIRSARRCDGSTFPAEITVSSITLSQGTFDVVAVRDATTQRLESLGQLAGGVAHDFNNLLGVILNYSTLIARRIDDPVVAADLGEIRAAAERGVALTHQLLTFARRESVRPEALDAGRILEELAPTLQRTLGEDIELRLEIAPPRLLVFADRHQLEQIVLNLATNAGEATPLGGFVKIAAGSVEATVATRPSDVLIAVTDGGGGMTADVVARAFEPFFTTKPPAHGTGLGLSIVHGIVEQSNGSVHIDSILGAGTTVTVRLPGAVGANDRIESRARSGSGGSERILFVEDELALREGMSRALVADGYTVVQAGNGIQALELFEHDGGNFDVVVTDVAMPAMRGDELARQLAKRHNRLPIIFMSGYDSQGPPTIGRTLTKPVEVHVLLRAIREAIDG